MPSGRDGPEQLATALLDWQDWRRRVRAAETKAVYLLLAYLSIAWPCCCPEARARDVPVFSTGT